MAVDVLDASVAKVVIAGAEQASTAERAHGRAASPVTWSAIDTIGAPAIGNVAAVPRPKLVPNAPRSVRVRVIGSRVGGAVACPPGGRREGYRLGRWERLSMTIVVTAALVVATFAVLRPAAPATRLVTVLPGDTMTSFVLRELPDMEVARAAELIEAVNGLSDPTIGPGMRLAVPANR